MLNRSLVVCYSPLDKPFIDELQRFLDRTLRIHVDLESGLISEDGNLLDTMEGAASADSALALLSPASVPPKWPLERWQQVFWHEPKQSDVALASVLVAPCTFPQLLRRKDFFDCSTNRLEGLRSIKRWLLSRQQVAGEPAYIPPDSGLPGSVEDDAKIQQLTEFLADRPGIFRLAGNSGLALRFASERHGEFEAVCRVGCAERSLPALAGELAVQLGLHLDGDLEANLAALARLFSERRVLVLFDDVEREDEVKRLISHGRSSFLICARPGDSTPIGDSLDEEERRLLIAAASCSPGGFRQTFAEEIAGEPRAPKTSWKKMLTLGLVQLVNDVGPEFTVAHAIRSRLGTLPNRRHAEAALKHRSLAEIQHAFTWSRQDPSTNWELSCQLGWLGLRLAREARRLAEAFEFASALFDMTSPLGDPAAVLHAARELRWILEDWGHAVSADLVFYGSGRLPVQLTLFDSAAG